MPFGIEPFAVADGTGFVANIHMMRHAAESRKLQERQGNRMNVARMASGRLTHGWSFRRMPESRFAEDELGPGLRRDDKLWVQ